MSKLELLRRRDHPDPVVRELVARALRAARWARAYWSRPEHRTRQRVRRRSPEVRARDRAYARRPEVVEAKREYETRPEVREKRRLRAQERRAERSGP